MIRKAGLIKFGLLSEITEITPDMHVLQLHTDWGQFGLKHSLEPSFWDAPSNGTDAKRLTDWLTWPEIETTTTLWLQFQILDSKLYDEWTGKRDTLREIHIRLPMHNLIWDSQQRLPIHASIVIQWALWSTHWYFFRRALKHDDRWLVSVISGNRRAIGDGS